MPGYVAVWLLDGGVVGVWRGKILRCHCEGWGEIWGVKEGIEKRGDRRRESLYGQPLRA